MNVETGQHLRNSTLPWSTGDRRRISHFMTSHLFSFQKKEGGTVGDQDRNSYIYVSTTSSFRILLDRRTRKDLGPIFTWIIRVGNAVKLVSPLAILCVF